MRFGLDWSRRKPGDKGVCSKRGFWAWESHSCAAGEFRTKAENSHLMVVPVAPDNEKTQTATGSTLGCMLEVDLDVDGDTFFPEYEPERWTETDRRAGEGVVYRTLELA